MSLLADIPAPDAVLSRNPNLDALKLAQEIARTGRVQIRDILTEASAQRLFSALERETPWSLIFNEAAQIRVLENVSPERHQELAMAAWERAHSGFQFFYHHYRLTLNGKVFPKPGTCLAQLVAVLNTPDFRDFLCRVTGVKAITRVTSTATLYKPLDFLTIHNDNNRPDNRILAYSLNMTPQWRPDWGGALQFFDRDDHIEEAYLPTFNTLNLFLVPKLHSVAQVSVFGGMRYTVSGWFHLDE